jgi:predicted nucleic acid-binding protein
MNAELFADTNILVYAFDRGEPTKQAVAQELLRREGATGNIAVSTQVLQEFYVVVTRKLTVTLPVAQAYEAVHCFADYPLIQVDIALILRAIKRNETERISFWDALIIEAALKAGCKTLLSEDMQAGHEVDGMQIRNPFANTNTSWPKTV